MGFVMYVVIILAITDFGASIMIITKVYSYGATCWLTKPLIHSCQFVYVSEILSSTSMFLHFLCMSAMLHKDAEYVYTCPPSGLSLFAFGQTLRQMLEMIKVEIMFNHAFSKLEKAGAGCPGRATH